MSLTQSFARSRDPARPDCFLFSPLSIETFHRVQTRAFCGFGPKSLFAFSYFAKAAVLLCLSMFHEALLVASRKRTRGCTSRIPFYFTSLHVRLPDAAKRPSASATEVRACLTHLPDEARTINELFAKCGDPKSLDAHLNKTNLRFLRAQSRWANKCKKELCK